MSITVKKAKTLFTMALRPAFIFLAALGARKKINACYTSYFLKGFAAFFVWTIVTGMSYLQQPACNGD
jgi:hypothetical protein